MHRIGGLEKQDVTGAVCYDPQNHQHMVRICAAKMAGIAQDIPCKRWKVPTTAGYWSSAGAAPTGP